MSEWYEPEDEYVEIDPNDGSVNIFVTQNDSGSIYVTLSPEKIKIIYDALNDLGYLGGS